MGVIIIEEGGVANEEEDGDGDGDGEGLD